MTPPWFRHRMTHARLRGCLPRRRDRVGEGGTSPSPEGSPELRVSPFEGTPFSSGRELFRGYWRLSWYGRAKRRTVNDGTELAGSHKNVIRGPTGASDEQKRNRRTTTSDFPSVPDLPSPLPPPDGGPGYGSLIRSSQTGFFFARNPGIEPPVRGRSGRGGAGRGPCIPVFFPHFHLLGGDDLALCIVGVLR